MTEKGFIPLAFERKDPESVAEAARAFRAVMETRRSVREFSREELPEGVIEECLRALQESFSIYDDGGVFRPL